MSMSVQNYTHEQFLAATSGRLKHLDQYKTLVLNADYSPFSVIPLSVIGWKEAIVGAIMDKFNVVHEYEGVAIRSPSISIPLPAVVAAKKFKNPDQTIPFSKKNVLLRDDYRCQYCGGTFTGAELTFDHVIPRSKGGGTDWWNIASACNDCNRKKGNNEHWISPLGKKGPLLKPYKPDYYDLAGKMKKRKLVIPEASGWENFINWDGPLFIKSKDGGTHQISGPDCEPIGQEELGM